ncbi:conserved hypothetical protein [Leishmania braziliensis MHOM/BR/75/M2904]|uniref:Uncharacterized protein n=2 Tax=Leishmania braziliensis TaxID=5660 RepID=A4H6L9_LEIBR|nr:conserved hypothetical protein [Leishmania braziliensis MHOM/BR/75/M2904]CAJ2468134.1 unnamed protein product [Leishmania braziliensis]CAJ2468794.1 unnamed protein product [Leishmania braziliensis]CAM41973.1 conserved hypothetical protein [Leishmania braziliensis MHOM/BR/75/M2904]SYZ63645.1 hypothetical_protein [Leishmania braziliensis MHOM/BR/75/M2904]
MVFDVNGDFVENEQQFNEAARKSINLTIKLQNTSGMSELIARVLEDDDRRASGAISASGLDFDELLRTTPRFNFLSSDHPLFRRYNKRLSQQRQAAALIAQRTAEAELQRQIEIKERLRKALEEEAALQAKKEQEKAELQRMISAQETARFVPEEPFLKIIKDESAFGQVERELKKPELAAEPKVEIKAEVGLSEAITNSATCTSATPSNDAAATLSAEELLVLVGVPTEKIETETPALEDLAEAIALPPSENTATYITLPAEEYTLCSGERVVSIIKKRTGPIPAPPPGKPPVINKAAASRLNESVKRAKPAKKIARNYTPSDEQQYKRQQCSRSPRSRRRIERDHSSKEHSRRHRRDEAPSYRHHKTSRDSKYRR